MPYRPLLTGAVVLKSAPQLGYIGLQIGSGVSKIPLIRVAADFPGKKTASRPSHHVLPY